MLSRPRIQPYAQLLMGTAAVMITATAAVVDPARITPAYLVGLSVIVASCVVMVLVWRRKPERGTAWISIVPLVSIIACAPLRNSVIDVLPVTGLLAIFPLAWLSFSFPPIVTALGVVFAGLLPVTATWSAPASPGEWMGLVTVTVLLALFAAGSRAVAVDLDRNRTRARRADHRLAAALDSSNRSDAALRQLLDTTPEAIVLFGDDDEVLLANRPAVELSRRAGLPISLAQDGGAAVFEDDRVTRVELGRALREEILSGALVEPRRRWIGKPGEQIAVRIVARPIVIDDEPIGVMVLAQDVTELVEAVDVRDRFLDTVGHELRTPLTVILGNADLALAAAEPEQRERWETVLRAGERLERTVELMLAAGRAHVTARAGHAEVRAAVAAALADLDDGRDDVVIEVDGGPVEVEVGARDLGAIVVELLRNARQVSPPGGVVRVAIAESGSDEVELSVADAGPGMTAAERRQAFDRFYRTSRARRSAEQGVGLGLALVQSLADAHGGEVRLDAGPAGGTTAVVRLPRAARAAADVSGRLDTVTGVP